MAHSDNSSNVNWKGRLQEYTQKKGLPLPEYSHRVGQSGWISTLVLQSPSVSTWESGSHPSKIMADQDVAHRALSHIYSLEERITLKGYHILLVDMENKPMIIRDVLNNVKGDMRIIGVAQASHPTIKMYENDKGVQIITVNSQRRDASDIVIILKCHDIIASLRESQTTTITLFTSDHFGVTLQEVMQQFHERNINVVSSIHEFINSSITSQ